MSRRKKYSEIGFERNLWWLERVNARTILKNEIVLDFDPDKNETQEQFEERILKLASLIKGISPDYTIFNSNRGIHVHIFTNKLLAMDERERVEYRIKIIKQFGTDLLKASERVTISLEYAPHWKSGKINELISGTVG